MRKWEDVTLKNIEMIKLDKQLRELPREKKWRRRRHFIPQGAPCGYLVGFLTHMKAVRIYLSGTIQNLIINWFIGFW